MRAEWLECGQGRMADFFLRPLTLTASNFKALQSIDPVFTVMKDTVHTVSFIFKFSGLKILVK